MHVCFLDFFLCCCWRGGEEGRGGGTGESERGEGGGGKGGLHCGRIIKLQLCVQIPLNNLLTEDKQKKKKKFDSPEIPVAVSDNKNRHTVGWA